jgi:hypothetical protein
MRVIPSATAALALGLGAAAGAEERAAELAVAPADGLAGDLFGLSVSVDGNTVVMGSPWHGVGGVDSGSAYVLVRTGSQFSQGAELTPDYAGPGDRFGCSVSVSGDIAAIGVPYDDDNGTDAGSVYVFVRSESTWGTAVRLTPGDAAAGDLFGSSVAVSGDTMVVGAPTNDTNGVDAGSAYVFVREGSTWTEAATLTPDDAAAGDRFGCSVSVSGDTAIVGAYLDSDNGGSSGSAYVFARSGSTWSQAAKLTPHDGAALDLFGLSVSVDGDTALVGAPFDDDSGMESGSAYVFSRSGSVWTQSAKLTAADGAEADWFGGSVSVSGDITVVGARRDDDNGPDSGSAYVFVRSGSTWQEVAKYTAFDGAADDGFGYSVSVSGDSAIVGAPHADHNGADSGVAYFLDLGLAKAVVTLAASDPEAHESGDPGSFTVTRTGVATDADLTVWYTVTGSAENGLDYNASFPLDGMVTILAGNTDAVVHIDPVLDGDIEGTETVRLTLVANPAYILGVEGSGTVVIAEDELPVATAEEPDSGLPFLFQGGGEGGCAPGAASPTGFTYCFLVAVLVLTWKRSSRDGCSVMRSRDTPANCGGRAAPCDPSISLAERAHQ